MRNFAVLSQLSISVETFARLAILVNGEFVNAPEAAEFAAWTDLRSKLATLVAAGVRVLPSGRPVDGVIRLVDHVGNVAAR